MAGLEKGNNELGATELEKGTDMFTQALFLPFFDSSQGNEFVDAQHDRRNVTRA